MAQAALFVEEAYEMRVIVIPLVLFLLSTAAVAGPQLLSFSAESPSPPLTFDNQLQFTDSVDRLVNQDGYFSERSAQQASLQVCLDSARSWSGCLMGEYDDRDNQLVTSSDALQTSFTEKQGSSAAGIQLTYRFDDYSPDTYSLGTKMRISSRLLIDDAGVLSPLVQLDAGRVSLWAGQVESSLKSSGMAEFTASDKSYELHLMTASPMSKRLFGGYFAGENYRIYGDYAYSSSSLGNSRNEDYQLRIDPQQDGWYGSTQRSRLDYQGTLFLGQQTPAALDQWHYATKQDTQQLGYRWGTHNGSGESAKWLGVMRQEYVWDLGGKLICAGKDWGLSGTEQTLACLFSVPFAEVKGVVDMDFTAVRAGREYPVLGGRLGWDNLLGRANINSKAQAQAIQLDKGDDQREEWLWVVNLQWQKSWHNLSLRYQWQQIIPLSSLDKATDETSSGEPAPAPSEPAKTSLKKDWLWPLAGGYQQIALEYVW